MANEYIVRTTVHHGKILEETVSELVRCKDCKHNYRNNALVHLFQTMGLEVKAFYCNLHHFDVMDDEFYCADGERREDE